MPEADRFGVLLLSGGHDRAHYAFVLATGAAALGRDVTLFATNAGCRALLQDWRRLDGAERDGVIVARGVAGLDTLRDAAAELGIRIIACEAGLQAEAIDPVDLLPGVAVGGVASFLEATRGGVGRFLLRLDRLRCLLEGRGMQSSVLLASLAAPRHRRAARRARDAAAPSGAPAGPSRGACQAGIAGRPSGGPRRAATGSSARAGGGGPGGAQQGQQHQPTPPALRLVENRTR